MNLLQYYDKEKSPSLYIHIPFCRHKCAYCSFYSIPFPKRLEKEVQKYFIRLIKEAEAIKKYFKNPLQTIYIGGGTPTLCENVDYVYTILDIFSDSKEITIESNLSNLTEDVIHSLSKKVTRLSVGIESFDRDALSNLSRFDDGQNIKTLLATRNKIKNFPLLNLDFITCIDEKDTFLEDFSYLLNLCDENDYLAPEHISLYALTIEEGTQYKKMVDAGKIKVLDDDKAASILLSNWKKLEEECYEHYETSAFARDKNYCRHNLNYWKLGEYIAIGSSAAGRGFSNNMGVETFFQNDFQKYAAGNLFDDYHISNLTKRDIAIELTLTGLRTIFGIDAVDFLKRTSFDIRSIAEGEKDLIITEKNVYVPSDKMIFAETYIRNIANKIYTTF